MRWRQLIARDLMLLAGYLAVTLLAVTIEVVLSLPSTSKWLFFCASAAFVVLVALGHWHAASSTNAAAQLTVLVGACALWALLGIVAAIVVGTNVKFLLGGQL